MRVVYFSYMLLKILCLLDNTFLGTLLAGTLLAFLGLFLYQKQKNLDSTYQKKQTIRELATKLLMYINTSVKDYADQIKIHNGENSVVKVLFDHINSISPGYINQQNIDKFNHFVKNINNSFNELSVHLTLEKNLQKYLTPMTQAISTLNFYLSTASTLPKLAVKDLGEIQKSILGSHETLKQILENVIQEKI